MRKTGAVAFGLVAVMTMTPAPAALAGDVYLVEYERSTPEGAYEKLTRAGADVIAVMPPRSYLVWTTRSRLRIVARAAHVSSTKRWRKSFNLSVPESEAATSHLVQAAVYSPRLRAAVASISRIAKVAWVAQDRGSTRLASVYMVISGSELSALARIPELLHVEPAPRHVQLTDERSAQIQAGNFDASGRAVPGYAHWLQDIGVDGAGVLVSVVDTGIDHAHPALDGRVAATFNYSRLPPGVDWNGHGTHVAGIIAGAPADPADAHDAAGFRLGLGIAPGAALVNQNWGERTRGILGFPVDREFAQMTSDAWSVDARILNGSFNYGGRTRDVYGEPSRLVDRLVRDPTSSGRSGDLLMVFAAGNSGDDGPQEPANAKNVITVGATFAQRSLLGPNGAPADEIRTSSSRGPTVDGRIFPTLVAPGGFVASARARTTASESLAACQATHESAPYYTFCSGTSMAAPHVSGAAALIHQWWNQRRSDWPSPAMVKSILVNGAQDIGKADVPNNDEGWGRVNLANVFADLPSIYLDQEHVLAAVKEERSFEVSVTGTGTPLKVTVAWTDPPPAPGSFYALVNDLDLVVERLGEDGSVVQSWYGNNFVGGWSVEGGVPDDTNNLENVYLSQPQPGRYRVRVVAAELPGDGIPFDDDPTDQDFALVIRNAVPAA